MVRPAFEALLAEGYLPEAIINYIALLGWCPADNREIFSLDDLCRVFAIDGISKSPSVFDYDKLSWFNAEYLRAMEPACFPRPDPAATWTEFSPAGRYDAALLAEMLQPRADPPDPDPGHGRVS